MFKQWSHLVQIPLEVLLAGHGDGVLARVEALVLDKGVEQEIGSLILIHSHQ